MAASSRHLSRFSLPLYSALGKGVPRKAVLKTIRELCIAGVIVILLIALLRIHHLGARSGAGTPGDGQQKWAAIRPRRPMEELEAIPRNIYYLTKEDVMYCYIPKNACSRFKPLMRKREGYADWKDPTKVHGKNGLQRLMWLSRNRAIERLSDKGFTKFVVVRDPFSRLASAYQNKVATPWPDQRADFWNKHLRRECPGMIGSMEMPADGALLSLEDFLKCLLSSDALEPSNEHWRPQSQLCGLDYVQYDMYLHLETLPADAVKLLDTLQWNENATAFQMHRNPVYSRDLAECFSPEALKLALEYYAEDFAVLGYPREPRGRIDFYSVFDGTNFQPGFVPPVDFQPPAVGQT